MSSWATQTFEPGDRVHHRIRPELQNGTVKGYPQTREGDNEPVVWVYFEDITSDAGAYKHSVADWFFTEDLELAPTEQLKLAGWESAIPGRRRFDNTDWSQQMLPLLEPGDRVEIEPKFLQHLRENWGGIPDPHPDGTIRRVDADGTVIIDWDDPRHCVPGMASMAILRKVAAVDQMAYPGKQTYQEEHSSITCTDPNCSVCAWIKKNSPQPIVVSEPDDKPKQIAAGWLDKPEIQQPTIVPEQAVWWVMDDGRILIEGLNTDYTSGHPPIRDDYTGMGYIDKNGEPVVMSWSWQSENGYGAGMEGPMAKGKILRQISDAIGVNKTGASWLTQEMTNKYGDMFHVGERVISFKWANPASGIILRFDDNYTPEERTALVRWDLMMPRTVTQTSDSDSDWHGTWEETELIELGVNIDAIFPWNEQGMLFNKTHIASVPQWVMDVIHHQPSEDWWNNLDPAHRQALIDWAEQIIPAISDTLTTPMPGFGHGHAGDVAAAATWILQHFSKTASPIVNYHWIPLTQFELSGWDDLSQRERMGWINRARRHNDRAKTYGGEGGVTGKELWALVKRFEYKCAYCGRHLEFGSLEATIDHVYPLALGGKGSIDNLVPACRNCNRELNLWDQRNREEPSSRMNYAVPHPEFGGPYIQQGDRRVMYEPGNPKGLLQ